MFSKLQLHSSARLVSLKIVQGGEGESGPFVVHGGEMTVHKEALIAFSESARIFIHYLSATITGNNMGDLHEVGELFDCQANDICKESKRQTLNADDVLKALEEIEFPEFVGPLKASLEDFRRKNAAKRSGAKPKENNKKRKKEEKENPPAQEEENEDVVEEKEEEEEEEDNDNDDNGDAHESEE
ncbi:hypothetical protein QJS10_CPB19g00400 [Acorus calamus]|uniref:Transcription factor CBF/NF-Y/archaeal histone domain-containing protein n=1 Tax=Acorus calamus TaxID=4465 RepID=A0AAV9CI49_ACOCL|nr:hypothetical protein QJS10_CPB19g00400 [Acorus calamus]